MKLTIFLIFSGLMTVSASIYSQSTKLSLELNHVSILDLFKQIESQSEFVFIYKNEVIDLSKKVDIKADALTVDQVLDDAFKDLGLKYEIIKKQIIVTAEHAIPSAKPEKVIQKGQQQPQKKQLKGKVTSAKGEPVPGTTVLVKGTLDGVITDMDGNFTMDVPMDAKSLSFSFVGMKPQDVFIGTKTTFNVALEEETFAIDEVVTVGYGTKKKRELIGSVAKVKGDEVANPTYENFVDALQGKATGVAISGSDIRIRGISSISNGSEPLFVVDGVIMGDALNKISSNDIESIDVQKDAAATSIFGSRATNGVVIITTKSGKGAKKDLFNIELNSGINQYTNDGYPLAESQEHLATMRLGFLNTNGENGEAFDPSFPYASWNSKMMPIMITDSLANATNNDWRKLTTRNRKLLNLVNYAGKYEDITISGSKAIDNSNAYVSLNYRNNEGMQLGNSSKRIIGKLGFNYTPIKNINFSFVSSITYWKGLAGASYGGPGFALPYLPAYDKSSTGYWNPGFNPLANADKDLVDNYSTGFTSYGSAGLELIVPWVKGLSFKGTAGWDYNSGHNSSWSNALMSGGVRARLGVENNWGEDYKSNNSKILLIGMVNFNRTFGVHKIDFVYGREKERAFGNVSYMTATNFPGVYHEIGTITKASFNGAEADDFQGENIILADFGRLSYSYKGKYTVEGSFRRDGYSKFTQYPWGMFSSVGLGWMLSDEEFFKVSWLNMLKLRGSIGQTGNSFMRIGNPAQNVYRIKADNNTYMNLPAEYLSNIGNPKARWETSTKIDAGFDYGLFGNKINGSVAYFINNIDGLLLAAPLPSSSGVLGDNSMWQNIGSMQNKGYEFSINAVALKTTNFSWEVSFNHTSLSNKVTKLYAEADAKGTGIRSGNCITKVGLPISTYFVPEWAGVDPEKGIPLVKPIDTELFDATGETVFTGGDPVFLSQANGKKHSYIQKGKSAMATFYGGFFNTFKYKNIDLGFNFTYSGGNYVFDGNLNSQMIILSGWERVIAGRMANSWEKPGDVKAFPQVVLLNKYKFDDNGDPSLTTTTNGWLTGDSRMLIKGDYLKLKMITLGYNLPGLFAKKIGIAGLRVYGSISNVWTLTDLKGDPEVSFGNNIDGLGANFTPIVRTCSLGLSAKF
ncbi:MAG TPA: SusC/RagA family TonB-linked outer membrane protein [Prolixibacteraceae bacterium]